MPNQHDIELYNLVHELLARASKAGRGQSEQRRRVRKPFPAVHRIAPVRGGVLPRPSEFRPVRCRDLNEGGFSFLLPVRPDFRELVASLGRAPNEIQLLTAVAHCREVLVWPSGRIAPVVDGECHGRAHPKRPGGPTRMFQVGCRFVRRLA